MTRVIQWPGHRWIALPVRLYLGGVFVAASLHKLASPGDFAVDVATYQLLPLWAVNPFALVVPVVEVMAGVMLVVGLRVRAAALLTSLLMVAFMVALGWGLHQNLDMSCGCFASQAAAKDDPISIFTMLRDLGWLALGVYVLVVDQKPLGVEQLFVKGRRT